MFKYLLLLASLPLLAIGGQDLYGIARSRYQVAVTCDDLSRQRPPALWLRVTGCDLDYLNPGYRESHGRLTELYFPVRPAGQPRNAPAVLVAVTRDPEALAIARTAIGSGGQPDQETFIVSMLRIVTVLRASREIEGYARGGLVEVFRARRTLASLDAPLTSGYVVIDLHQRPRPLVPIAETATGAVLFLTFVVLLVLGRRRRVPAAEESAPTDESIAIEESTPSGESASAGESTSAGEFAPVAEDTLVLPKPQPALPAMLLLNLGQTATRDSIEQAPPLGSGAETRARLQSALPGMQFDETGRGTLTTTDCSLRIDLGNAEPVWTATVRSEGERAPAVLQELVRTTGWRLYVPKRGTFFTADLP